MEIKKLFFPIGGGDNFEDRLYGALLVSKALKTHISFLASQVDFSLVCNLEMALNRGNIFSTFKDTVISELDDEKKRNYEIFSSLCDKLGITISDKPVAGVPTAEFHTKEGVRSKVVEYEAKFCDMIVAACPPEGEPTATFDSAVIKSGKNAIVIPRTLTEFKADNILIGWNGTSSISRAITQSMFLLKNSKKVHIIVTNKYFQNEQTIEKDILEYLSFHGINATFEVVKTTSVPGEALLQNALNGKFDMVIASSYGENGLKEMYLGGTTKYFLQNTPIPVFM